jgi:tetrahydromethanopterin S-methyltransferase subunit G
MQSINSEEEALSRAVIRLSGSILGITLGLIVGLLLFVATNWLVLKGGENVGQHLMLLSQFFPGYRVTFAGSCLGLVYGFLTGFAAGWIIAMIYNRVVAWRSRVNP